MLGCAPGAGQVEVSDLTGCGRTASAAFDANDPEQTSGVVQPTIPVAERLMYPMTDRRAKPL